MCKRIGVELIELSNKRFFFLRMHIVERRFTRNSIYWIYYICHLRHFNPSLTFALEYVDIADRKEFHIQKIVLLTREILIT